MLNGEIWNDLSMQVAFQVAVFPCAAGGKVVCVAIIMIITGRRFIGSAKKLELCTFSPSWRSPLHHSLRHVCAAVA